MMAIVFKANEKLSRSCAPGAAIGLSDFVYARHGRELMGCKSPIRESC
jgi:hypothetical protein